MAVGVADAVDVGQQHELTGADPGRDARGDVVGVDVADDPVLVAGERRHDRHLAADEDRVEEIAAKADDVGDEADARDALRDEQPAVDAGQADRVDPQVAETRDEFAVDDSPENRRGDLERRRVRHAEAVLEPRRDAHPLEPLRDAAAAAVDEDHGTVTRDRGHFLEHLGLVADRRPAQLDDEDLAHVVYSLFSTTYSSVRSQPNASPVPSPSPRSRRIRSSGASIEEREAARSKTTGPPCPPEKTR